MKIKRITLNETLNDVSNNINQLRRYLMIVMISLKVKISCAYTAVNSSGDLMYCYNRGSHQHISHKTKENNFPYIFWITLNPFHTIVHINIFHTKLKKIIFHTYFESHLIHFIQFSVLLLVHSFSVLPIVHS